MPSWVRWSTSRRARGWVLAAVAGALLAAESDSVLAAAPEAAPEIPAGLVPPTLLESAGLDYPPELLAEQPPPAGEVAIEITIGT